MSNFLQQKPLVLASGSSIRATLLKSIGLEFLIIPSQCNEEAIKKEHQSEPIVDLGFTLAISKALEVSSHYPGHFVIGADQLCVFGDLLLDKPLNHETAIKHLSLLNANTHQQIACMCIAQNNKIIWQHHEIAYLTMRKLNSTQIDSYLKLEQPYQSCGAYQYETQGKWLFQQVVGDEDTILGLPLLPLIDGLIDLGVVSF
ncbi:MAG: Maf family protein [bacterium]|nr:Maf family protein [bacterium]